MNIDDQQLIRDWRDKNLDPEERADAVYDIISAFNYIDSLKGAQNINVGPNNPLGDITEGSLYGIFRTKADMLNSFFKLGYSALRSKFSRT